MASISTISRRLDFAELPTTERRPVQKRPRSSGHYRRISTILADLPVEPSEEPRTFQPDRSRRSSFFASTNSLHALATMGFGKKEQTKDKRFPKATELFHNIQLARPSSPFKSVPRQLPDLLDRTPSTGKGNNSFTNRMMKKQKSLAFLSIPRHNPHVGSNEIPSTPPLHDQVTYEEHTPPDDDHNDHIPEDKFILKNKWMMRDNTKLHPYPDEAPYMQAYDPIILENEIYVDLLLRKLYPAGSPSFLSFITPPATVLDLGCGQGLWILYAASIWKDSEITGFDLVDVTLPEVQSQQNLTFVRGNFVKFKLPFGDGTFDLVRMSNLSLSIPHEKWDFVLREAHRVLNVGGRLEVIDDHIFFPYGQIPTSTPVTPATSVSTNSPTERVDSFDDSDDTLDSDDGISNEIEDAGSTLFGDEMSHLKTGKNLHEDPPALGPTLPRKSLSNDQFSLNRNRVSKSEHAASLWERQASASKDIEKIFSSMLTKKFEINPRPSVTLGMLMKFIFGSGGFGETKRLSVSLAPAGSHEYFESLFPPGFTESIESGQALPRYDLGPIGRKNTWPTGDKKKDKRKDPPNFDDNERNNADDVTSPPPVISAKAAGRLGISDSILATAAAGVVASDRRRRAYPLNSSPAQSPGILVSESSPVRISNRTDFEFVPKRSSIRIASHSTFIPMTPAELEMHSCAYIHTLLGCRHALLEFIRTVLDEKGERIVSDEQFHDSIWEYECFRRPRFNWPELPDYDLGVDHSPQIEAHSVNNTSSTTLGTCSTPSDSSIHSRNSLEISNNALPLHDLTRIRTIRVFEAIKLNSDLEFAR